MTGNFTDDFAAAGHARERGGDRRGARSFRHHMVALHDLMEIDVVE